MQGSVKVIHELNQLLTGELTASDQYFTHSRMYENWGFRKLYERLDHERLEELQHSSQLIHRILFLGGVPNVASRDALKIGSNVPEMIQNDLDSELAVIKELKKAIGVCEAEQDYESRRILIELLRDTEEDHTHWLEVQQSLIAKMGLQNYLQSVS
ncbi:MAG: bacterioferritin [Oligoflexia bacterium]|nr:bacterioferritin [Oligoflexia bacterium]